MGNISSTRQKEKHFSDVNIGKILELINAAWPQRKIAAFIKCTQNTIQNILAIYVFEIFQERNSRREYPWKISEQEDKYILHILQQSNDLSLQDIINKIILDISTTTFRRRRSKAELRNYIMMKKPDLSVENIHKWLDWVIK